MSGSSGQGNGRGQSAPRALLPVLRELAALAAGPSLSPAERRVCEQSQLAQRVVLEAGSLGQLGQATIAELAVHTTRVYERAVVRMLGRKDQVRGEECQAVVAGFTGLMVGELATELVENQRFINAQIKRAGATPLRAPEPEPQPRSSPVALRRLTLAERLSGQALIVHQRGRPRRA